MVQDEVLSLFPIPVLVCQYPDSFDDEWDFIRKLDYCDVKLRTKNTFILEHPKLSKIREFIDIKIKKFTREIMLSYNKLDITQSWVNKSGKGASHHDHIHSNSIVSGVWYPHAIDNMPPINFYNKIDKNISLQYGSRNNFNSSTFFIPPMKGDLILFPSDLSHGVPENKSDEDRYSLSFNTWAKGDLGEIDSLNYLPSSFHHTNS
jgi:uncharacterized protein (TIGR02466 family)